VHHYFGNTQDSFPDDVEPVKEKHAPECAEEPPSGPEQEEAAWEHMPWKHSPQYWEA